MSWLQIPIGYVIGRFLVASLLLPQYFKGSYFTAYEVLDQRFGGATKQTASALFIIPGVVFQALGWEYLTGIFGDTDGFVYVTVYIALMFFIVHCRTRAAPVQRIVIRRSVAIDGS